MNEKKIVDSFEDIEIYQTSTQTSKIGAQAMKEEREKNHKLGIPSAFMQNGQIYYELADGSITKDKPWGQ